MPTQQDQINDIHAWVQAIREDQIKDQEMLKRHSDDLNGLKATVWGNGKTGDHDRLQRVEHVMEAQARTCQHIQKAKRFQEKPSRLKEFFWGVAEKTCAWSLTMFIAWLFYLAVVYHEAVKAIKMAALGWF